jgi:hypothetical protein
MDLSNVNLWIPLTFGFSAGVAVIAMVGNWLKFVLALRQSASPFHAPKAQLRIMGFPLLAFISPVPWIFFLGLPFAAYFFIGVRHSQGARLFFATIGVLVLVWVVGSIALIWRLKRRQRQKQSL